MIKMLKSFIFIASYFFCINAYSYKETTHQDLSQNAVYLSNIVIDESLLYDLGLKSFNSNEVFVDPDNVNGKKISIVELFRGGAKYEDRSNRALNHFYNPVTNLPLPFIGTLPAGSASPNWALEDNSDVDPELTGAQEYSYKDAMNYFHLALTSATIDERELNWAKTFQTLGQVIHHIQDMAQPDHARNDAHLDVVDSSWYEKFTDDEKGKDYFTSLMTGNAYPIPVFDTAREFWITNDSDITLRRGIADFTNRNFVTKDTMFKFNGGNFILNSDLPLPEPLATRNSADISDPSLMGQDGQALCDYIKNQASITFPAGTCNMEFLETTVYGAIAGENTTNARAATLSIFNKKLDDHNLTAELQDEDGSISYIDRSFTLNEFNFKARYDYLIPRAVAYSAGLINHFFRGKIDMVPNPAGEGWVIKNLTDEDMAGLFSIYYDEVDGSRKVLDTNWSTSDYSADGILAKNSEINVPTSTELDMLREFILVFRGKIGQEGAIESSNDAFSITSGKIVSSPYSTYDFNCSRRHIIVDDLSHVNQPGLWKEARLVENRVLAKSVGHNVYKINGTLDYEYVKSYLPPFIDNRNLDNYPSFFTNGDSTTFLVKTGYNDGIVETVPPDAPLFSSEELEPMLFGGFYRREANDGIVSDIFMVINKVDFTCDLGSDNSFVNSSEILSVRDTWIYFNPLEISDFDRICPKLKKCVLETKM